MRTATLAAALGLAAACAPASAPVATQGPQGRVAPAAPERLVSERVILRQEPGSPFIAFNIWIRSGSANDPAGREGLAALTASLLAGGSTRHLDYETILGQLYPMATGYGASTDKEMTVFRGVVHRDNLERFYTLLRDAVTAPAFKPEDFERVKTQTLTFLERGRRFARDEELTKELLYREAYRGTPYEHPVAGYVQSVHAITLEDVQRFYETHYRAGNVTVALGGGFPGGFSERVVHDFQTLLPAGAPPRIAAPQPRRPERVQVVLVDKPTDASPVSIGYPIAPLRSDPDFPALMLTASWMGEHRNFFGRLFQEIREQRGLNYGSYTYVEAFPNGFATMIPPVNVARRSHLFEVWIRPVSRTEPGNLHDRTLFATRAALRRVDRLIAEGMPAEEVVRTQRFLPDYMVNWGTTVGRRLAYDVDDAFYGIPDPGFLTRAPAALAALTPAQVNAAVRRQLDHGGGYYIVVVTEDAEGFRQKLLSGEPTPITYAGERSPELLAEDQVIAAYPIRVRAEDIRIIPIGEVLER
jgi:zinc protease